MSTVYSTGRQHFSGKADVINPAVHHLVIFDMDGVVTDTAKTHAAAWKKVFDEFLKNYCRQNGCKYEPFDIRSDYLRYVDGKAREDGARSFLASRHIQLQEGDSSDSPDMLTIHGIGRWKDAVFHELLEKEGVETYPSTIRFIHKLKENGVKVAIISASKNATQVLEAAGALDLFDTKVDGIDAEQLHLPGKPEPDVFLEAAKRLGCVPEESVVVEDALAGVQAGEAGHFSLVIGIDREHQSPLLKSNGADVVVDDLSEVDVIPTVLKFRKIATPWLLIYEGYTPEMEGLRETLCTLGNGYFATRGAAPESVDDGVHYPGTYGAGGYNRVKLKIGGQVSENEDLVNFPNWLSLNFKIGDGGWFSLDTVELVLYRQVLDLKNGVLHRKIHFRDAQGRETLVKERRFVHMCDYHLAGMQVVIRPLNWEGKLTVRSAIDGRVRNNNIKTDPSYRSCHLRSLYAKVMEPDSIFLKTQMRQSELRVAQAARTRFFRNKEPLNTKRSVVRDKSYIAQDCELEVGTDSPVTVEKIVSLYTSQDNAISECGLEASKAIRRAPDFTGLLVNHKKAWHYLWKHFDIEIETHAEESQKDITALAGHLHIFHLLQTISPNSIDLDIDIPARGWHGEAYRGHIFWDNLFVFPFFNLRMPEITESLLKYRSHRLDEARSLAKSAGYQGAMYPWQSGSNGEEETQKSLYIPQTGRWITDYTHLQRHSGAAVAYNIWEYYQATADIDFMYRYGAEMMLEIARFWASLAVYNSELERYEIQGVVGPDEYHVRYPGSERVGINNNAYTNVMAVWCLCRALTVLDILPEIRRDEIRDRIGLDADEMARWEDISRKMRVVFLENGVISQFEGFENLAEFPWNYYRDKYGTLQHLEGLVDAEGDSLEKYQIIKQADVLMLFYLFSAETLTELFTRLGYHFKPDTIPLNIAYYTCRTIHGSSLSRVANAWVLARSDRKRSWKLFQEALMNDLNDTQGGTTVGGIHLGAMGGTLDLLQRCYSGLELREGILWFNPLLPKPVKRMAFHCHYRENLLKIEITSEQLLIQASFCHAKNIQIGVLGQLHTLQAGETKTFHLE